jgi:hypothetical protein
VKKTLGSLILFLSVSLFGSSLVDYHFKVSNYNPFVKEAVEIEFTVTQLDKSAVMFFELKPHNSKDFELHIVGKRDTKKSYHESKTVYKYMLFPLKSDKIELNFDFKVLEASDAAVEKFYTGNRDVINPMATKDTDIVLKPLVFEVKEVRDDVALIGDYRLDVDVGKTDIASFEQLNIVYTLEGQGYPSKLKTLLPQINGVEQFLELERQKDGKDIFHYAFLSKSDFVVPAVEIACFSPTKRKYYTLKVPAQNIKVASVDVTNVLDEKDSYPTTAFDWSSLLPYLNGFLLMLSGYIIAKLDPMQYLKKSQKQQNLMHQKIKDAKDEKSLMRVLISSNERKFKPFIEQLESSIYDDKKCDLNKLKASLLEL